MKKDVWNGQMMLYIFANTVVYFWKENYLHWYFRQVAIFFHEWNKWKLGKSTFNVECNVSNFLRENTNFFARVFQYRYIIFFSFSRKHPKLPISRIFSLAMIYFLFQNRSLCVAYYSEKIVFKLPKIGHSI